MMSDKKEFHEDTFLPWEKRVKQESSLDINSGWKHGDPIGYIRKEIPDFKVPEY